MRTERTTTGGLAGCAGVAVLVGSLGVAGVAPATPVQEAEPRFDGEYGLYVGLTDGGVDVRWFTTEPSRGVVRAFVEGEVVAEKTTGEGQAHAAWLEVQGPSVVIEYGADEPGRLHRTKIHLEALPTPDVEPEASDSIYIFGDVHGEFDRMSTLLEASGLIDEGRHWTGGEATVALLGDLFDRGDDVTRLLWFLYGLEREASAVGGEVLVILGNHEVMVMSGDLRYVSGKEARIGLRHGLSYAALFDPARSVLGRWLASKPGLVRLDDLLLAHGGVSPAYRDYSLREFQDSLGSFIAESLFVTWNDPEALQEVVNHTTLDSAGIFRRYGFFFGPESVLWYRDLVLTDTLGGHLEAVLDQFDAEVHVVAHTPVRTIQERYDGKLIAVDLLDAASEMLLLVRREEGGWDRFKVPLEGSPEPLGLTP